MQIYVKLIKTTKSFFATSENLKETATTPNKRFGKRKAVVIGYEHL